MGNRAGMGEKEDAEIRADKETGEDMVNKEGEGKTADKEAGEDMENNEDKGKREDKEAGEDMENNEGRGEMADKQAGEGAKNYEEMAKKGNNEAIENSETKEDSKDGEAKGGDSCMRHKHRQPEEEKSLISRLNRIEGQVRGIKAMVQDDRYCMDILVQVSAVQAALSGFSKVMLSNHIRTCVVDDIKEGKGDESIDELCGILCRLMK